MPMAFDFDDYNQLIWEESERPRLLIEGDSWVSTPHTENLAQQVNRRSDLAILNIASPGDEAVTMLSGNQRTKLREALRDDDYDFPALLFSAGGNDIVGQDLYELLHDLPPGAPWQEAVNEERLQRRVEQVRLAYLNLIDLRDDYRPDCVILSHGYDRPIPTDTGARLFGLKINGPWMKPYMTLRGITDARRPARPGEIPDGEDGHPAGGAGRDPAQLRLRAHPRHPRRGAVGRRDPPHQPGVSGDRAAVSGSVGGGLSRKGPSGLRRQHPIIFAHPETLKRVRWRHFLADSAPMAADAEALRPGKLSIEVRQRANRELLVELRPRHHQPTNRFTRCDSPIRSL